MYGALVAAGGNLLANLIRGGGPEHGPDEATRKAQAEQLRRYKAMQEGKGPSLGRMALQQGLQQATSQQQAMAASARGGPLQQRLAQRTSQMAGAQMAGRANQSAAQMRAREQMAAMGRVDQSLAGQEAQRVRDYRIRRGEFDQGTQRIGNLVGGISEATKAVWG